MAGLLVTLVSVGALTLSSPASAYSSDLEDWRYAYPNSTADDNLSDSCALCHTDSYKEVNGYGWDYIQYNEDFSLIESLNSDNDPTGATNLEEITANTQPGWTTGANHVIRAINGTVITSTATAQRINTGTLDPSAANQPPTANAGGPYNGTQNMSVTFDGKGSKDTDGSIQTYSWDFGDGSSGSGVIATHTYRETGTYNLTLRVTDDAGDSATDTTTVTIGAGNQAPVARTSGPYSAMIGAAVQFDASSSTDADGSIASYSWSFGDGMSGNGVRPTHSYSSQGTYNVTLTVTDNDNALDSVMTTVSINPANQPPVADPGNAYFANVGEAVMFDGSGSTDPDGSIASYAWNFGDSTSSTEMNPSHTYAAEGSYTVSLTVTDNQGLTGTAMTTVSIGSGSVVSQQPPVAQANGPYSGSLAVSVNFSASGSVDPDGTIVSYEWNFGDGETISGFSDNVSHAYNQSGSYTVTLKVTDNDGLMDMQTTTAIIGEGNLAPVAEARGPYSGKEDSAIRFNGSQSHDQDGSIVSYVWDFGDGSVDNSSNPYPEHIYTSAGIYNVTLTVADNTGAMDADSTTVLVIPEELIWGGSTGGGFLLILAIVLSLSACGKSSTDDSPNPTPSSPTPSPTSAPAPTSAPTAEPTSIPSPLPTNVPSTPVCGTVQEGNSLTLNCPSGQVIKQVIFASYGTPSGSCGSFTTGSCNASNSLSVVSNACNGKSGCTVSASNNTFGDPCGGTSKKLSAQVACNLPTDTTPLPVPNPNPNPTPTPVPTSSPTWSPTPVPTSSPTSTPTPTPVPTSTPTWYPTPVPTSSPTPTPTMAPIPTLPPTSPPTDAGAQEAIDVIDDNTYDGNIPLSQKVIGNTSASLQTNGNPFENAYFYLSPDVKTMMDSSLDIVKADNDTEMVNKIKYVQRQPSAVWMDATATIHGVPGAGRLSLHGHLDAALAQQQYYADQNGGKIAPMTVVIIVYNLPDRDCAAFSSNGQLIQVGKPKDYAINANGDGFEKYKQEYIGPIAEAFDNPKYRNLRIVALLEPDSFPNMITNTGESGTSETANTSLNPDNKASLPSGGYCDRILNYDGVDSTVSGEGGSTGKPSLGLYAAGLRYAINAFAKIPNVYTYMDIGHAGWLGWDNNEQNRESNMKNGVKFFKQLVDGADGAVDGKGLDMIRGFASNTSGYTPVDEPKIAGGLNNLPTLMQNGGEKFYQWNPAVDELTYIQMLKDYFTSTGPLIGDTAFDPNKLGFIIDTARNGWGASNRPTPANSSKGTNASDANRVDKRVHRGHWCNVNKAGIGESPKAKPSSAHPYLDAFFWMKPPGESDGISFKVNDYLPGTAAYNNLDPVDKAIVDQANDPVYAGKSLDTMCIPGEKRENVTVDVVPAMAPHAGAWFHKQYLMLIKNAYPPLGESDFD